MDFSIREYDPSLKELFRDQFVRYAKEDLGDDMPERALREKICRGVFEKNWKSGVSQIAIAFADGEPAGFAIYQVDTPDSDWCKRPGWGLIREFCIVPAARRRGYGRALAAYAVEGLRRRTGKLYLTAHDAAAAKFWTACGFQDTGIVNDNGTRIMERFFYK